MGFISPHLLHFRVDSSSNSIPSYDNITLDTYNKVIKFSSSNVNGDTFTFNQQHGLYTGEIVYYKPNTILGDEQFIESNFIDANDCSARTLQIYNEILT